MRSSPARRRLTLSNWRRQGRRRGTMRDILKDLQLQGNPWIEACAQLIASKDAKPLAQLLRSDAPMPAEARDILAGLLEPDQPDPLNARLVLQIDEKQRKKDLLALDRAGTVFRARAAGKKGPRAA